MKINAEKVRLSRAEHNWSQDELAVAAGLNLRTIQRIETQGVASLQSKKALAAALDIQMSDLDQSTENDMPQYEFKTLEIQPNDSFQSFPRTRFRVF